MWFSRSPRAWRPGTRQTAAAYPKPSGLMSQTRLRSWEALDRRLQGPSAEHDADVRELPGGLDRGADQIRAVRPIVGIRRCVARGRNRLLGLRSGVRLGCGARPLRPGARGPGARLAARLGTRLCRRLLGLGPRFIALGA